MIMHLISIILAVLLLCSFPVYALTPPNLDSPPEEGPYILCAYYDRPDLATPFDHPPPRGIMHDLSPPYCSKKARASKRMFAPLSFSTIFTSVRCYIASSVGERCRAFRRDMSACAHIVAVFCIFNIFTKNWALLRI